MPRRWTTATFVVLLALLAALGAIAASAGATSSVWLCRPGLKSNPCEPSQSTTRITPSGRVLGPAPDVKRPAPKLDCFYVYPTVSDQDRVAATLRIDPEERDIALYQAARFSPVCRVYAPMYRQITIRGLGPGKHVTPAIRLRAYTDVRDAWREYLHRYNKGRGVVLIGHSQGSSVLRPLIAREVDGKPTIRRRLVSAILLGGNVLVKKGQDVGGDFKHVRACRSQTQLECVVAFSTFNRTPPADTLFGRARTDGLEVLCTNPAALGGGSAALDTIYPARPFVSGTIGTLVKITGIPRPRVSTPWIEAAGAYRGRCSSAGGANVLRIAGVGDAPMLNFAPVESWGLHIVDANIALGNLVTLVRSQAAAYARR